MSLEREKGLWYNKIGRKAKKRNVFLLPIPAGELMPPILEIPERGRIFMSTYEEFNTILTIALLIVAILNLKNK